MLCAGCEALHDCRPHGDAWLCHRLHSPLAHGDAWLCHRLHSPLAAWGCVALSQVALPPSRSTSLSSKPLCLGCDPLGTLHPPLSWTGYSLNPKPKQALAVDSPGWDSLISGCLRPLQGSTYPSSGWQRAGLCARSTGSETRACFWETARCPVPSLLPWSTQHSVLTVAWAPHNWMGVGAQLDGRGRSIGWAWALNWMGVGAQLDGRGRSPHNWMGVAAHRRSRMQCTKGLPIMP